MNGKLLSEFRFWPALDKAISKSRYSGERRDSLYPSEASVVAVDPTTHLARVQGGCMRKSWYRLMRFRQSDPPSVKSEYIFEFGRMVEKMMTELAKLAGVYDNNSVKFWDKSSGVSGEIDIICKMPVDNGGYVFVEAKSTWGGNIIKGFEAGKSKSLFDHYEGRGARRAMVKAKPKIEHVLQIVTYLFAHKDDTELIGGKLVYFLRDNMNRTEFDIYLIQDVNSKHRIVVNGVTNMSFYAEDVYVRYKVLADKVNASVMEMRSGKTKEELAPPDRDYALEYTTAEVEAEYAAGEISDSKYKKWQEGKIKPGSWQCSYCSYTKQCYNIAQPVAVVEDEEETNEAA